MQLVTKSDGLKIHDFYNDQRFFVFLSWHIVLLCKGVDNYCTSLCHFESNETISYNVLHLLLIFYTHYIQFLKITIFHNMLCRSSSKDILKTCNISITFDNKTWRIKHWLHSMWLLLMWLHLIIHAKKRSNACSKFKY